MALTLDATVGGTSSNSYCTVAEAETYFESRLHTTDWDSATTEDKTAALVWATRLLDEWIAWKGYKATDEQTLRWPRYSVYDRDGYAYDNDELPQWLKDATAEQAKDLLTVDVTAPSDTQGFSEIQVETLRLKIDKADRDKTTTLSDAVIAMVEYFGIVRKRGGTSVIALTRA